MEDYTIRKAKEEDLETVLQIQMVTMPEPYSSQNWTQLFKMLKEHFFIAEIPIYLDHDVLTQTVKGYALGDMRYSGTVLKGHIISIAVLPNTQKKGLGKALLTKLEANFKFFNANHYYLEVREHNEKAVAFYKKNGFRITNIVSKFYINGDNAIIMEK